MPGGLQCGAHGFHFDLLQGTYVPNTCSVSLEFVCLLCLCVVIIGGPPFNTCYLLGAMHSAAPGIY
jgi:hypothetical protein